MQEQLLNTTTNSLIGSIKLDPLKDGISSLELVRVSGSDLDVVNAARVSFGKVSTTTPERMPGFQPVPAGVNANA